MRACGGGGARLKDGRRLSSEQRAQPRHGGRPAPPPLRAPRSRALSRRRGLVLPVAVSVAVWGRVGLAREAAGRGAVRRGRGQGRGAGVGDVVGRAAGVVGRVARGRRRLYTWTCWRVSAMGVRRRWDASVVAGPRGGEGRRRWPGGAVVCARQFFGGPGGDGCRSRCPCCEPDADSGGGGSGGTGSLLNGVVMSASESDWRRTVGPPLLSCLSVFRRGERAAWGGERGEGLPLLALESECECEWPERECEWPWACT